jgi:hypothetical protein
LNFGRRHFANFARLIVQHNLAFKGQLHFLAEIRAHLLHGRSEDVKDIASGSATIGSFTPSMMTFY